MYSIYSLALVWMLEFSEAQVIPLSNVGVSLSDQPLKVSLRHYAWGQPGATSSIRKMCQSQEVDQCFAEVWVEGHLTHPRTPLHEVPLLMKVLNVRHSLSIQVHPSQKQAPSLHRKDPLNYPDVRGKPELAVVISEEAEVLVGFCPLGCIRQRISRTPELAFLADCRGLPEILSECLRETHRDAVLSLETRLLSLESNMLTDTEALFLRIASDFPGDMGALAVYYLEFRRLNRFDGLYIKPGVMHAYLSGDLLETMGASDNVVRGGLTPKFVDQHTLLQIVSFDNEGLLFFGPQTEHTGQGQVRRYSTEAFTLNLYEGPATISMITPSLGILLENYPDGPGFAVQLPAGGGHLERSGLLALVHLPDSPAMDG